MVCKTCFMLAMFIVPLIVVNTGLVTEPLLLFALYIISGFGTAGIGMGVMHDAIHGSYSKNRKVNQVLGYSLNLIGGSAAVWKIQHNVLHHTYTNIEEADDDINAPFFLRFSPHATKYWIHKYQHFYAWLFYGLSTISWVISKDFVRLSRYKSMDFFKGKNEYKEELLKIIAWKLLYLTYALVLPLVIVPMEPWIILLAFLSMHFTMGLCITIVFQTAHIMPGTEFPLPDEGGLIASDWSIHQLATTSNYSPKSRIFTWFIGGLNYQIEHHLLPNICHVHYKKLSPIVAETAREFGLPYNSKRTFIGAVGDHLKMLRHLGKVENVPVHQELSLAVE